MSPWTDVKLLLMVLVLLVASSLAFDDTGAVTEEFEPVLVQSAEPEAQDTAARVNSYKDSLQQNPDALGGLKLHFIKTKPKPTKDQLKANELKDAHLPIPMSAILNESPKPDAIKEKPKKDKLQLQKESVDHMVDNMVSSLPHAGSAAAMGASGAVAETEFLETMDEFVDSNPWENRAEEDDLIESSKLLHTVRAVAHKAKLVADKEAAKKKRDTARAKAIVGTIHTDLDSDEEETSLIEQVPPVTVSASIQKKLASRFHNEKRAKRAINTDKQLSHRMRISLEKHSKTLKAKKERMLASLTLGFGEKRGGGHRDPPPVKPVKAKTVKAKTVKAKTVKAKTVKAKTVMAKTSKPVSQADDDLVSTHISKMVSKQPKKVSKQPKKSKAQKKAKPAQMIAHHFFSDADAKKGTEKRDASVDSVVDGLLNPKAPEEPVEPVGPDIFSITMQTLVPTEDSSVDWTPEIIRQKKVAQKKLQQFLEAKPKLAVKTPAAATALPQMPHPIHHKIAKKAVSRHKIVKNTVSDHKIVKRPVVHHKFQMRPTPSELVANLRRAGLNSQAVHLQAAIAHNAAKVRRLTLKIHKARYMKHLKSMHHKMAPKNAQIEELPQMPPPVAHHTTDLNQ